MSKSRIGPVTLLIGTRKGAFILRGLSLPHAPTDEIHIIRALSGG